MKRNISGQFPPVKQVAVEGECVPFVSSFVVFHLFFLKIAETLQWNFATSVQALCARMTKLLN